MKLGISTCWDFVSGKNTKQESQLILESFGSLESYLQFLKGLGIASIELRYFDTGLNETDLRNICSNLKNHGFSLTVHGEIFEHNLELDLYSTFPWLQAITEIYNDQQLLVVVHPIEGETKTENEYRHLTVRKIKNIIDAFQSDNLNVKIALEIMQYDETLTSPGCTYENVLDILTEIHSDDLGICFDFGHAWSNARRGFLDKNIPDTFLDRVIHAHIHDLGPGYKTHWPLTHGNVPVEEYLNLLAARHFNGVLNLELVYNRFKNSINTKQAIELSLQKLGNIVKIIG